MSIPFKPRNSLARRDLKEIKDKFDDPSFDSYELLTEFSARQSMNDAVRAYQGEFFHQLALRRERRGEFDYAERLYKLSLAALKDNPLGKARTARDYGTMLVRHIDAQEGLALLQTARSLHAEDTENKKGQRQRLITESYWWRAQIHAGTSLADESLQHLIELVDSHDFDFCVRDQKIIIDFLVPRTSGEVHRELLARQISIHLQRRNPLQLATASLKLVIDIELSIVSSLTKRIFGKE
ncbi:MAG: hypothetical protein WBK76_01590 [Candidatus Saccharimonadales bacterium]